MLTELVDIFRDLSLRHKGVRCFRYQDKILNNAQNNYGTYQVYMSTTQYHQLNITNNIFRVEIELYILGQPKHGGQTILDVQDDCYTIAADILAYIDVKPDYQSVMSLYDYDIVTLDHYTDDDSAGVKLSVVLAMPSPVNLCELDNNFNAEPYEDEPENEITVDIKETPDSLKITRVKLPKNGC